MSVFRVVFKIKIILIILLSTYSFAQEKITLQLKWFHQFQFAGYYAAKEKGFYDEVGLDVEIKQRDINFNNVQQVIDGEAQYGVADSVLLIYKIKDEPAVIVAPVFQHSPSVLVTLKDSQINSPYSLNGKDMIFYESDTDGFSILAMLKKLNIKPNIIRKREKDDYLKLMNKEVDATPAYLSNELFYFKEKKIDINVINPMHYGFDLYGDMLFTNKNEANKNPERVIKFKEASLKGWEYALNNKEEIIQLIHDKYNKDKSIEHLRFEADIIEEMVDRKNIPLGTTDKGRFQYITELYKEYGLLEKNLQLKDFIFEEFNNTLGLTKKEHNYLKNKKEITYCIDPNWMPFEKLIDGKHVGISSDFFSFFQEEIDIPFTLVPTKSWTESVEFAKERKCDILTLAMETEERKRYFSFTNTYLESPLVLITRNDEFFISNIKDIGNKKIGMIKGYAYKDSLKKKYPNINIIDVNDIEDGLDRVNDGKLYGFIDSLTTTAYQIQNNYLTELKVSAKFDEVWKLGIASRNDEPLLTDILDKVIHKMSFENRQIILNKWVPINIEEDTNYRLVVKWVLGTMAIFGFILYIVIDSNNKLNKEVKKRKKIEKSLLSFNNLIDQHIISSSTDLDGYIIDVSSAFCKRSKYTKEELLGEKLDIIRHPDMPKEIYINLWETIGNNNVWKSELKNKAKDGSVYWVHITISPIYDEYGNKIGYTSISQDITDKKTIEEISITDGLTNIYNRRHFNEFFPKFINSAKRDNQFISFLIMDVDFFKQYNDTYGHQKGDDALIAVANALKNSTHRSDDYCFRLGGEEFGLLFKSSNKEKAFEFANVILKNIENLKIEHKENKASKYLTASMGLYSSNANDVHNIDEIYKNADIMLYKAKETGRNRVVNS